MFKAIKEFFTGKPAVVETSVPVAEYKVEAPVVIAVGEPPATVVTVEGVGAVSIPAAPAKKPAAKKPAAKKAPAVKKPRVPKAK
jgi:hypothetical protein